MKAALMGGSFDPVHLGHLTAAKKVKEEFLIDKIIFVPAYLSPFKTKSGATAEHRFNMLSLAIDKNDEVSRFEIDNKGISYTYLTAQHFKNEYDELYFIIGDEAYRDIDKWKKAELLHRIMKFIVVTREDIEIPKNVLHLKMEPVKVSSTEIREKLLKGEDCSNLLPQSVLDYIIKNNLYKE